LDATNARHRHDTVSEIRAHAGHGVRLSASVGVASSSDSSLDASALVKASDDALYRAKRAGRDRVEIATR